MDNIILIFLVQITVYRQEKRKKIEKNEVEQFQKLFKKKKKPVVEEFEFGIIKDRCIPE